MSAGFGEALTADSGAGPHRPWRGLHHPVRMVVVGFGLGVLVGTAVLALPLSRTGPGGADLLTALFTATSALCVTGLVVVDTATYWSPFGQATILALIQVGGFGIMTLASLLGLLISRRLGLSTRMAAATETKSVGLGDVRRVLLGVARITLTVEAATALVLTVRFATTYRHPLAESVWLGVFHSVSAFNNAGFALFADNLVGFAGDPWVCLPVVGAVIVGGLGFPVVLEVLREHRHARRWSVHTRLTLLMTAVLLVGGTLFMLAAEWTNPHTLGALDPPARVLAGFFQAVMPRTAGFNSVDPGAMNAGTLLASDVLMFIGGGSAGTAGGIKVGTFAVLLLAILAELRGAPDVELFDRRLSPATIRQALAVSLLGVAAVVSATLLIATTSRYSLDQVLYEVVSAFATVGLSTGITDDLAPGHQLVLVVLMFAGRLGPVTFASALVLRESGRLFRRPEGRPLIG
ncbi:TrkH family potassium uptake protein [Cellulomonas fimi]|uniref:H(+)-transporting two-sector ATPase n=1 Tax=Cellulomonas fimi (strain ATCC 484 / DSM 20113 / JCM 1341 / CCUG 24087 / LMG 16345 / NBRC 15513 / NCIMB 8980 / NCTC 7547 / NRS-133) TaxID=590998 RepID=F4H0T7_CELFA|nr:potassium transporter TrkG [Cellulomonas fimi]AEE46184.1 H(+)-transporting two-sector ATPase [Cellulomonas fimi ATCC 484]VEH31969.1 Ktr system potassium uptake protein B [Cellulomonas fimi]